MRELILKFEAEILRLRWLTALTNLETAVRRDALAQKAGFRSDQLRDDLGRWTSEGVSSGSDGARVRLASGQLPEIPKKRPSAASERLRIAREIVRVLGRWSRVALIFEAYDWLEEYSASAASSLDQLKSLEELQSAVSNPQRGYDTHHNVERNSAAADGSEDRLINAPENLVRIPRWKHWAINGWYQTKTDEFEGMSPREYLQGKSWEERVRIGHYALRKFGVLKP